MPDAPNPKLHRSLFLSLPIFWQVLGLSLSVLVLALSINTLVVLKAPSPPPSGYTISEAATALKGHAVRLHSGRYLRSLDHNAAPDFVLHPRPLYGGLLELQDAARYRLAQALGAPESAITINFPFRREVFRLQNHSHGYYDDRMGGGPNGPMGGPPPDGASHGGNRYDGPHVPEPPGHHEAEPGMMTADTGAHILFPAFDAAWKLPNGHYRVIMAPKSLIEPWQQRLLIGFGLTALLIVPLAYLLSRRLSRPITAFSEAAAKLSVEDNAPPILSAGPREVRQATDVVNAMQTRIRKQIESRTMLMGAIAHDLKTPLARMRLRIEALPADMREKLSQDIAHMDGLIRSAMSFTSAHKLSEQVRPLDISALTESLIEDLGEMCEIGTSQIEPGLMVRGDQVALTRILTNLMENAGRYAQGCRVHLAANGDKVELSVLDDGPGLPPDLLETVFEPFYRLESSRNRDTGGTGLGLSVARALAEAQGGTLTLHNRYDGDRLAGLEARLVLPRLLSAKS